MKIERLEKGQLSCLPCIVAGGKESFATIAAPCNGVKIKMTVTEGAGNCIFISEEELEKSGFISSLIAKEKVEKLTSVFMRAELAKIAGKLGLKSKGTKEDLAKRISSVF